jgi:hypothetical protein
MPSAPGQLPPILEAHRRLPATVDDDDEIEFEPLATAKQADAVAIE